jgi:outer membrane protein assembly factor BamE (lipoprotein component of BamABCDE complex)
MGLKVSLLLGAGLAMGALLAGCDTISQRIEEKAEIFSQLGPEVQESIQRGQVKVGYTLEMVYMALGRPNSVTSTPDGKYVVWTYMNFNTPDGDFMLQPKHITHNNAMNSQDLLFQGGNWQQVTGKADLDEATVALPETKIRRKTAQEMIEEESRQDLEIAFQETHVVDFRLIRL